MEQNRSRQEHNVVEGDLAGRDVTKIYTMSSSDPTPMRRLIDRLKQEREGDTQFLETLDDLKHYTTPPPGEDVEGLERKLRASGREGLIKFATRAKEVFAKKLLEYQFSETGQEILAMLLAEVYSRFQLHVAPAIRAGLTSAEIHQLAQTFVIDEVWKLLDDNPLGLNAEKINGMVYYLTGNCHIRWTV